MCVTGDRVLSCPSGMPLVCKIEVLERMVDTVSTARAKRASASRHGPTRSTRTTLSLPIPTRSRRLRSSPIAASVSRRRWSMRCGLHGRPVAHGARSARCSASRSRLPNASIRSSPASADLSLCVLDTGVSIGQHAMVVVTRWPDAERFRCRAPWSRMFIQQQ